MYTILVEYESSMDGVEYPDFNSAIFFARLYAHIWPGVWSVTIVNSDDWNTILYEDGVCVGV